MKKLKQKRAELIDKASAIAAKAEEGGRELTSEEADSINATMEEVNALTGEIESAQKSVNAVTSLNAAKAALETAEPVRSLPVGDVAVLGDVHDLREDDPTGGFKSLGEYAEAIYHAAIPTTKIVDERLTIGAAITGMGQKEGSIGGFGVPDQHANTIWMGLQEGGDSLLSQTDNFTVEGDILDFPAVNETSRADGSRWGGVRAFWLAEGDQATDSNPTLRKVVLEPQQLIVKTTVTNKLLKNNTVALDQFITRAAISEIDFMTGDAIINGTGVGQPLGILNSGAEVQVARAGGNAVATADIDKMRARLHPRAVRGAGWKINQEVLPEIASLEDGNGNALLRANRSLEGPEIMTLKGLPVEVIEYAAALGTTGDIILASMKGYTTGTRGGIDASMSIHLRFDFLESVFLWVFEVDGKPWLQQPITPFKGNDTLSHFVTLT